MNRLKTKYLTEIKPKMKEEFKITSDLAVPQVKKIVINVGSSDAKDDEGILTRLKTNVQALSGQAPVVTKAKQSISAFKLTQGAPIGVMVTLRGDRMYAFLDKMINLALPKVRDFRGVPARSFDGRGNYNLGLREQTIFPEVEFTPQDKNHGKIRGLQVTITMNAKNPAQGRRLLELMGMPFMK